MTTRELIWEKKLKIDSLKKQLAASDYKAIKYAEGEITSTDYIAIRTERRGLRAEINALETEINLLEDK